MTRWWWAALLLLIAVGCGGSREERVRREVHQIVAGVVAAYGGEATLREVRAYRAEGLLTAAQERRQGDLVRWFERPDRSRTEIRYPDRGELRVTRGGQGWAGADDRRLEPVSGPFLQSMLLQTARLDLPFRLMEQESLLVMLEPDGEERHVLRLDLGAGMLLDCHIREKSHRIEKVSVRLEGASPMVLEAELNEFRFVHGVLFPFREDTFAGGRKTAITRFRNVELNPSVPPELLGLPR